VIGLANQRLSGAIHRETGWAQTGEAGACSVTDSLSRRSLKLDTHEQNPTYHMSAASTCQVPR